MSDRPAAASRWTFNDPVLLSLFPATYVLHLAEEWFSPASIVHWTTRAERPRDTQNLRSQIVTSKVPAQKLRRHVASGKS
jgi:hypothetical protein